LTNLLYRLCVVSARPVMSLLSRWEVHGRVNVPATGGFILAVNHCSYVDPVLLIVGVPRYLRFMVKSELYRLSPARWFLRAFGTFSVRRGFADRVALAEAQRLLAEGHVVVLFPEGTRSRMGRLLRGLPGTMALAVRSGVPVLPVAIMGTETVRGWLGTLKRPRMVLRIGEPYRPERPEGRLTSAALQALADDLMLRIAAMLPEERHGAYAKGWNHDRAERAGSR